MRRLKKHQNNKTLRSRYIGKNIFVKVLPVATCMAGRFVVPNTKTKRRSVQEKLFAFFWLKDFDTGTYVDYMTSNNLVKILK